MTRDQAKIAIQKLIERFAEHRKAYHAADYNEAKTRQDFINPFFKALGWDVDNENGMSEAYREVIYEDKVVVRGKAKAPDYGFRLMGQGKKRLFYVEAKKPSVALKANKDAAYQLRRYGSSAQAPISILTNFEDFFVYDCSKVPNLSDSASVSRLKHIHFEDYVKEFDFIYDTFSHEAVTKGRFDKFVQSDANKKGSQTLDKEFVQSLDTWRKYLATSIAINNKKINDEELNFCVQLIIDRLIFLRFCEDRSVEPYGQLQSAASKGNAYNNLFELFEQADAKYNSGLFDFEKDKLTATLKIDNKVVKNIVEDLYFPQCRYEFSVMPVEVLGNAYEQFLGKVIRILPSRGVKIEEKPEVRKAGGVFYTPQYIVDYIVKNTVGKLIDGKAPKEIDKIKIVDPACGSGSFLVGAFEYLLNYHSDWYYHNLSEKEKKKGDIITPDGKLTTHEKKRILINNIYGVDIDANAVEVSKLSLLLKCMEGETEASIKQQVTMFHERVLPDLDNNIKDGNSLIDVDFYDEQFDLGYEKKIKPFSWKKGFPEVFKQGGFNAVIGNPPYGANIENSTKEYFQKKYKVTEGNYESYSFFIESGAKLLSEDGLLGYIIPDTWFTLKSSIKLRKFILDNVSIKEVQMLNEHVFKDAKVDVCTFILSKKAIRSFEVLIYDKDATEVEIKNQIFLSKNSFTTKEIESNPEFSFSFRVDKYSNKIISKLQENTNTLENFCLVGSGCKPYEKGKGRPPQSDKTLKDKVYSSDKKINKTYRKLYRGEDVSRYFINKSRNEWLSYGEWLAAPRNPDLFNNPRLLFQAIRNPKLKTRLVGTFVDDNSVNNNSLTNIILKSNSIFDLKFFLAILNSKLLNWYFRISYVIVNIDPRYLKQIPIPISDLASKRNRQIHDDLVKYVNLLLSLNENLVEKSNLIDLNQIKQRIEHCEEKINSHIYELYELTQEEINIVEGVENE